MGESQPFHMDDRLGKLREEGGRGEIGCLQLVASRGALVAKKNYLGGENVSFS